VRTDDKADLHVTVWHGIDKIIVDKTDEFLNEIYPIDAKRFDNGDIETFDEISNNDISKNKKHLFVGGATLKVSNIKLNGNECERAQVEIILILTRKWSTILTQYGQGSYQSGVVLYVHCKECQASFVK
jgi:hypothetical protein